MWSRDTEGREAKGRNRRAAKIWYRRKAGGTVEQCEGCRTEWADEGVNAPEAQ